MENGIVAELRDRLQQALNRKGWKAVDLVERTGVPKGAVSYYLAGKSKPKTDRLYIIAQALDVSEAWLLGYDVSMARTDDQKKNDQLAKLVVKLRTDEGFFKTVCALAELTEDQYHSIELLVSTLKK
jgi:transcriptional regulator with XRE-family HTH domain